MFSLDVLFIFEQCYENALSKEESVERNKFMLIYDTILEEKQV